MPLLIFMASRIHKPYWMVVGDLKWGNFYLDQSFDPLNKFDLIHWVLNNCLLKMQLSLWGSRDGELVRELVSHRCGLGSNSRVGIIQHYTVTCGLSLLSCFLSLLWGLFTRFSRGQFNKTFTSVITYRAKLLNADWLRQRAFFLNFPSMEGKITRSWLAEQQNLLAPDWLSAPFLHLVGFLKRFVQNFYRTIASNFDF